VSGDDEREIVETSRAWSRAIVANDAAAIARFVSDDWVLVDQTGVGPRGEFLSLVESGELTHTSMRAVDGTDRVRIYGDTAVHTARVLNTAHYRGAEFPADEWTTDVYVRTPRGWICVLSHVTPVAR
jgi:ketosteroid isomerase-like protein